MAERKPAAPSTARMSAASARRQTHRRRRQHTSHTHAYTQEQLAELSKQLNSVGLEDEFEDEVRPPVQTRARRRFGEREGAPLAGKGQVKSSLAASDQTSVCARVCVLGALL